METVTVSFDEAQAALSAGRIAEAEAMALRALAQPSVDARFAELLGVIRAGQGRLDEAADLFTRVASAFPDHGSAWVNAGIALYRLNRFTDAAVYLERAAVLVPESAEVRLLLGTCLPHRGRAVDLAQAHEHLAEATRLRPDWAVAHLERGRVLAQSSREPEAEASLRRGLELEPRSAAGHLHLGQILLEQDRPDEAEQHLSRALELDPQLHAAQTDLDRLRARAKGRARRTLARYPRSTREFADVDRLIEKYILPAFKGVIPSLAPGDAVFTLGSCFAQNIARTLQRFGVDAQHVFYPDDINNTFANRYLLEAICDRPGIEADAFRETFSAEQRATLRAAIARSPYVIISLGVAPCFFHRATGRFAVTFGANFQAALQSDEYEFRTTTVAENIANLEAMIALLRGINPNSTVILTVSPVPLKATFEFPSAFIADCISKSTLRVVAHEVVQTGGKNMYYWPSFEMVRWFGGHVGPVFGTDDDSPFHVSQAMVDRIMQAFIGVFGTAELVAAATPA